MWKIITVLLICCSSNCIGQLHKTIYAVVGDTERYVEHKYFPSECEEKLTITDYGSSDSEILSPHGGVVRFIPTRNGTWYDTVKFSWRPTTSSTNEGCMYWSEEVYIKAIGYDDSTVKIRSRDIYIPMRQQQAEAQWDGYFGITLDNNIASVTEFKNFKLRYDLPPGLRMEITDSGHSVTSYTAKPFERKKPLMIHLWIPGGTMYDSALFQGALELDAVSADTTIKLTSYLHVTVYPFVVSSTTNEETIQSSSLNIFPNPSGSITQFLFSLPFNAECKLCIINDLGEEIRRISYGVQFSGTHSRMVDLSDLPSGHYICELKAGGNIIRKKVIVIR